MKVGNTPLEISNLPMMGGGAVVGKIPKGLPEFSIPELNAKSFLKLLPTAIIISLLGFMEGHRYRKSNGSKDWAKAGS